MKRFICAALCLMMTISFCASVGVTATDDVRQETIDAAVRESFVFTEAEQAAMEQWRYGVVIKAYRRTCIIEFSENKTIAEILDDDAIARCTKYITAEDRSGKNANQVYINDHGRFEYSSGHGPGDEIATRFLENVFSPYRLFETTVATHDLKDLVIRKMYCLDGTVVEGMVIYYETNQGDYVYYTNYPADHFPEFLMPRDVFCEVAAVVRHEREQIPDNAGGNVWVDDIDYDFSPYLVGGYVPSENETDTEQPDNVDSSVEPVVTTEPSTESAPADETTTEPSTESAPADETTTEPCTESAPSDETTTAEPTDETNAVDTGCAAGISSAATLTAAAIGAAWVCRKKRE